MPSERVIGGSRWYKIAPVPISDASVSSSNYHVGSGHTRTGACIMSMMMVSWASCCSFPHTNGVFFFVRQKSGTAMIEKFLQNMQ